MNLPTPTDTTPGLLVSVRSAAEARIALKSGADVIDVKEPKRGPLGPADPPVVAEVVRCVAQKRMVTAAAGELGESATDAVLAALAANSGAQILKLGIRQALSAGLCEELRGLRNKLPAGVRLAPAIYADLIPPSTIGPEALERLAQASSAGWLVVDTCGKTRGGLLTAWRFEDIEAFIRTARSAGFRTVLAGSLSIPVLPAVSRLGADLIGLRGAVCQGGRQGRLSQQLVEIAKANIRST